jgi:hypothetical protein
MNDAIEWLHQFLDLSVEDEPEEVVDETGDKIKFYPSTKDLSSFLMSVFKHKFPKQTINAETMEQKEFMIKFMANLASRGFKGKHLIGPELEEQFSREDRYVLTRLNLLPPKDIPVTNINETEESLEMNKRLNIEYFKENYNEFAI